MSTALLRAREQIDSMRLAAGCEAPRDLAGRLASIVSVLSGAAEDRLGELEHGHAPHSQAGQEHPEAVSE